MKFHYNLSPSPLKVALLLEELNLHYEAIPVDLRKNPQLGIEYVKLNPHEKVPTLQDGMVTVFDSNAILLYLADRENKFLPSTDKPQLRATALSWLAFITGDLANACKHTRHFRYIAPQHNESNDYALSLFDVEAQKHWAAIETHLSSNTYFIGDEYSIVDMAFWSWSKLLPNIFDTGEATWERYPNVKRLTDLIEQRPAVKMVEKLKNKHNFKVARRYRAPSAAAANNHVEISASGTAI
jgi:GSH-dependent disulfide-bond oxidoreductase